MAFASFTIDYLAQNILLEQTARRLTMIEQPSKAPTVDLDLGAPTPENSQLTPARTWSAEMSVDLTLPGKQHGHLVLPLSESPLRDGYIRLPVCIIRGKTPGPTITFLAGIHGDEFEGPLTLQKIARELDADQVSGCIILIPSLNLQGLQHSNRHSPYDKRDMDTCFPGNPKGSISERLAHEVFAKFIAPANLVVDLRSGGSTFNFAPTVAIRSSKGQRVRASANQTDAQSRQLVCEEAMFAFGAPNCVRMPSSAPNSCLQACVDAAEIPYLQTELGGGGACSAENLSIALVGCYNVLRQQGLLSDEIHLRSSRILEVRDNTFYVQAKTTGLLEMHARLGSNLYLGDPLASIVNLDDSGSKPIVINVPKNSVLLAIRHAGPVKSGDLIAILADEVPQ